MAVSSKVFVERFGWRDCNELLHPHSCGRSALINVRRFIASNAKYYIPVALLHFLKRALQGYSLEVLLDALSYYAQLIFGGLVNACLISTSVCALRQALGEFHLYTLLFVPSAFGAAFIAGVTPRVKRLQHTAIFQSRGNPLTRALGASKTLQTLLFMCCSALILHGKQRRLHNGFWFLTPDRMPPPDAAALTSCSHERDCGSHIAQGVRNYFLIGLAMDVFKMLIGCAKTGLWSLKQLRLESATWLSCYMAIYRTSHCYLKRKPAASDSLKHIIASFLGGLSYLCYPKLSILSYALLEAMRTLWNAYNKNKTNLKKQKSRFGYSDVIFPLALAYLIHNYVFEPGKVSVLAGIIIDSTTANYAGNLQKRMRLLEPSSMG
ncbi:uncharacterized protein LOC115621870 isoform X3 [Scaptodrosophila lebanonensis]|uniref:Uncharacterized protein LOC115621870 isoform X3 n=1 Tax=Drosophila lebanonensis TaxID=7225 RepID=A0A6J2T6A8_DROLE|nr:uncharacterized protein LOC115621870 isoform X3 [Scaptodrosophila lebanonensis]